MNSLVPRLLPPFACSVRGCSRALERRSRALVCAAGHSFDVARSGYVNLLQPQDRRSLLAGDSSPQVEARRRLALRGAGNALIDAVGEELVKLAPVRTSWLLEVGCGPGVALPRFATKLGTHVVGLDLSSAAIERASRAAPELDWVVANADRRLPFLDNSIELVVSVAAPKQPAEFRRILRRGGHAVIVVPAHDDLIELRAAVQGEGHATERAGFARAAFAADFEVLEQRTSRERVTFDGEGLHDILLASYRGGRSREAERAAAIDSLEVTLSAEILIFRPRD